MLNPVISPTRRAPSAIEEETLYPQSKSPLPRLQTESGEGSEPANVSSTAKPSSDFTSLLEFEVEDVNSASLSGLTGFPGNSGLMGDIARASETDAIP